ncbi:MAG: thioredoxin family protein [Rhodospirillaceae bacterium]|nr:thioredoxin family protein [Rhodospirillaceae bacterium]
MKASLFLPRFVFAVAIIFSLGATSALAREAASPWTETDFTSLRLIAATNGTGGGETVSLGLHFKLRNGWKIYWRSAGDAGYPPSLDWKGSENLKQADMRWPLPHRFSILGLETLGYKDEVVYPITAWAETPGAPMQLRVKVDYLTCSDICVPYEAELTLDLPGGGAEPSPFAHLINRFAVQVPGDGAAHGLTIEKAEALAQAKDTWLRITARATSPFTSPDVFIEGPDVLAFDRPMVRLSEGGRVAVLTSKVWGAEDLTTAGGLVGTPITLTLADGKRAAEKPMTVTAGVGAANTGNNSAYSFAVILALAVLGGLILNLMPCVLPVLSIKLLGVVGHGGRDPRDVRLSFVASAAGIIFSFLVLAATLIGLKAAGLSIGWGIQFQQPWFLIAMTVVVTLFACNLWGLFEFRLPHWVSDVGDHAAHSHGLGGHFLTGAFATLLATPCSAPFLGTAVGFALARDPLDIVAVFAALGLGLALPYLLIAALPGLATRLPKPGRWMVVLRRILGFALAATAVWLISVLAAQTGTRAAWAVGALMIGAVAAVWLGARSAHPWRVGGLAVAVLAAIAFSVPSWLGIPADATLRAIDKDPRFAAILNPFDRDAIPGHVAAGHTVLVDVTADWCITCQINKTFVLASDEILTRLGADNIIVMQADWTLPDDAIADYLASFGRYGIPFNAVYGPALPNGLALPELLTKSTVLDSLDQAAP